MFNADRSLGSHRWHVVRLPAGHVTEVVLLSTRAFALTTHWVNCTVLCPGDDCRLCELLPSRGLFYFACMWNSRVAILELGALSAGRFEQHCKLLHGGLLPGHVVALSRRGAKQPVHTEVVRHQENCQEVSQLELAAHVLAVYKFPCPNPGEDLCDYELRSRHVAKVRSDRLADSIVSKNEKARSR